MAGLRGMLYLPSAAHYKREALRARLEEFVNECHNPSGEGGGQFCSPEGGSGESEAEKSALAGNAFPNGYNAKGKPNPGGKEWLEVHGIDRAVFEDRPYVHFEQGAKFSDLPASVQAAYEGEPEAVRQFNKIADQSSGFIMVRQSAPGSPEAGIVPQTRPDVPIVTDKGAEARAATQLQRAQDRVTDIQSRGVDGIVELQQERVKAAQERLEDAKTITREGFLKYSVDRVAGAVDARDTAKAAYLEKSGKTSIAAANKLATDDPALAELRDGYAKASDDLTKAQRTMMSSTKAADHKFGEDGEKTELYQAGATENALKALGIAQDKLTKYQGASAEERSGFFDKEVKNAEDNVKDAQRHLDETAVKYVFPPNPARLKDDIEKGDVLGKAGRVSAHMADNVDRLVNGTGRVYLAMEGNIKEDALLSAVRREGDQTASVISVPSVTLWRNKDMAAIAQAHLGNGREVVLIPDADGVNNPRVRNEARALQSFLESTGSKVVVAPPPIPLDKGGKPLPIMKDVLDEDGKPVLDSKGNAVQVATNKVQQYGTTIPGTKSEAHPEGVHEELKGVDDYLGLGKGTEAKGTLGNLAIQHRIVPPVDLAGIVEPRAVPNAEKTLRALSNIFGPDGAGRIGTPMLTAAIGDFGASHGNNASRSLDQLENAGIIKRELIFDPDWLARGRRVLNTDPKTGVDQDRINELVRLHVIDRPDFYPDDKRQVDLGKKETPIISIRDKKYIAKDSPPTPLESLNKERIKQTAIATGKSEAEAAKLLGLA